MLPTTTSIPDFSGTSLPPAHGTTTQPAVAMKGGNASISGRVTMGGSPVGGATVRIERLVGDQIASAQLVTRDDGGYSIDQLEGGRYRIRGFRSPDAAMPQAQVVFLGTGERRNLELSLDQFNGGVHVAAAIAPDPPELGEKANVAVQVTSKGVDSSGVARAIPTPNVPLVMTSDGGRVVTTSPSVITDSNGRAQWTVLCLALEDQKLTVILPDGAEVPVNVSACRLPPTTTTTVESGLQLLE